MLGAHDRRVGAENRRALDDVLQFANVARPAMDEQRGNRIVGKSLRLLVLARLFRQEVARSELDVLEAFAQRRQRDREDVQAIVQILAELARRHDLLEQRTAGGDDAALDRKFIETAKAANAARLERPQQFRLQLARKLVNLVEKDRSERGQLEQSLLARSARP